MKTLWLAIITSFSIMGIALAEPLSFTDISILTSKAEVNHSGRTDKNGCHRDTKSGTRHCH